MRKYSGYIIFWALSAFILLSSCRKDEAEVIPRDDLAMIYAEMFMTDQWILNTPNVRLIADTSLVYAPILDKYGYDAADYRKSVDHYMDDPERFSKILRTTGDILENRLKDLVQRKEELERLKVLRRKAEQYRPDIKWEEVYMNRPERPYIGFADSLAFDMDSTGRVNLIYVERGDTMYDGVRMVLKSKNTVAVAIADTMSLGRVDTLEVPVIFRERKRLATPDFMKIENGRK